MAATNNERASAPRLRVGLIADADRLAILGPILGACPLIELVAHAGMPQTAALPQIAWFDDQRVLIAQVDVQAVLLATSTRADAELGLMAGERGLHVWRLPPVARSFSEATEIEARVKRQGPVYHVASWWEHVVDHAWCELEWPEDFRPLFSDLRSSTRGPLRRAWQSSLNDAAGGALANDGYASLEALVALRGLPDTVVAATGSYRYGPGEAVRETEDTAVAILRYAEGGTAVVRATWGVPPFGQRLVHHASTTTVILTDEEIALADHDGVIRDRRPLPGDYLAGELLRFVGLVAGEARDRAAAALERHLAVTALLETIYLAARTGHPESPRKLYDVQGRPVPQS